MTPGEFHEPDQSSNDASAARHAARYTQAVSALFQAGILNVGGSVVDAACGTGYGTQRLQEAFPEHHVVGVDRNSQALFRARRRDVEVNEQDLGEARFWLRRFKPLAAVVSIETLEHLDGAGAQRRWLASVASNLEDGGLLWLACPIVEVAGPSLVNPYHLWEPTFLGVCRMVEWTGLSIVSDSIRVESYISTGDEAAWQLALMARK